MYVLRDKSLHRRAWRHLACLVTPVCIIMTFDGVTSFYEIHVNASITVKVLGRLSFHVMAENWKHLKETICVFVVSCVLESK